MVIRDDECQPKRKSSDSTSMESRSFHLASPLDRAASFIIDHIIVLMPVIMVFCAPFERQLKQALMLGHDVEALAAGMTLALMSFSILLIYHAIFTHIVGATVGQLMMGLRVLRVWDLKNLGLWNATLRSLIWFINVLLLGIPSLAVFSDANRRTWYDRISDSVVITVNPRRSFMGPSLYHRSMIQGFFAALFLFFLFVGGNIVISNIRSYSYHSQLIDLLEDENVFCRVVGDAQESWPDENGKSPTRVSVALGMYLSGDLGLGCLEDEFDSRGFANQEDSLARLTKAIIYSDHSELSDLYLNSVCDIEKDGAPCRLAQSMLSLDEGDVQKYREQLLSISDKDPVYAKFWAINELLDQQEYHAANELIQSIPKVSYLAESLVPAETKVLFGLKGQEVSEGAARVAYNFLAEEKKAELSSWLCYEELSRSCEAWDSASCEQFNEIARQDSSYLEDSLGSMAYLSKKECESPDEVNYLALLASDLTKDVKKLISAKLSESVRAYRELAFDPGLNTRVRSEAMVQLLKSTNEQEDFLRVQVHWVNQGSGPSFFKVGQALMSYFMQNRDYEQAASVAEKIYEASPVLSEKLLENYIVAEFNLGRTLKAKQILQVYKAQHPALWIAAQDESELRSPASSDEFRLVVRSLK